MDIVSLSQLFGGKVTAALDRQHPRDLFDIASILKDYRLEEIKNGILFFMLCSGRPIDELIKPNLIDQELTFTTLFEGMAFLPFSYDQFLETRINLIRQIQSLFNHQDKKFILSFFKGEPLWEIYDFKDFPSIKWKQMNLLKLKETNEKKFEEQWRAVEESL